MTKLKCHVSSCVNFTQDMCDLGKIDISGTAAHVADETCCGSFVHKSKSITTREKQPEVQTEIACNACDCTYNSQLKCASDSICVEGDGACDNGQTCCETFKVK